MEPEKRHFGVAVVGAGFAGLGMGIRLRQKGSDDFAIFERFDDVGGVWRDNSYPGCACDVQSYLFSLSFAPNPGWTRAYAPQSELWQYARGLADRFELWPNIRLNHEVRDAAWIEGERRWRIETSKGTFTADVLILGTGSLSEPSVPKLPGLESFEGKAFHSSRWDHGFDLGGKNVAVVGTGASSIQIVPAIQPHVGRLYLFQRTPAWVVPRFDFPVPTMVRRTFAVLPLLQLLVRAALYLMRESLVLGFLRPRFMKLVQSIARSHLRRAVSDPELRELLTPTYQIGCKRILVSDDYYPALAKDNVSVVRGGVKEVRPRSIVGDDGVERPVDAIVFSTGFQVTDPPFARHVRGRDGRTLMESWGGSPQAHLGTTVAGFPNLFMLQGPNTGLGHTSVLIMIESQIEHVIGALDFIRAQGSIAVEPRPEAQAAYVAEVDAKMRRTVWITGGCMSWYIDATGRNSSLWPGSTFAFRKRVARFDPGEYQER